MKRKCMRCKKPHQLMMKAIDQVNNDKGWLCAKCIIETGEALKFAETHKIGIFSG